MMRLPGFTESDGWEKKEWCRTLTVKDKKRNDFTATYI